jgi:protease-4
MDGLAASGGYYAAVACDKIIASPTTITGSIGVIMGHMDISRLLEEKLGIKSTTIKSGEKKDWPSMFREISIEEKAYLMNKLIEPAYSRFVQLVVDGRKNLSTDEVTTLADGSIYFAQEAMQKGLIDDIGYFETAVAATIKAAGLENASVVEYTKPFSLSEFIGAKSESVLNISKNQIIEMTTPDLMYLWTGKI